MNENQKQYELVCILPPQLEGVDLENTKKEIEKIINQFEGSINFGKTEKRNLAYPVNKGGQGIYLVSQVSILPEKIAGFSKELKLNKQVLRHLITQLEIPKPAVKRERPRKVVTKPQPKVKEKPSRIPKETPGGKLEEIDKKLDEIIDKI